MSGPAGTDAWAQPAASSGVAVTWSGAAPGGAVAAPRAPVDVARVLRLVAPALLLVAAGLVALAPFLDLVALTYEGGQTYSLTGWQDSDDVSWESVLFGLPMTVTAALLLIAAVFAAAAVRVPRLRPAAGACACLAAGMLAAVVHLVLGYVHDYIDMMRAVWGDRIDADSGAGTILATLALVAGLCALLATLLVPLIDRARAARGGVR